MGGIATAHIGGTGASEFRGGSMVGQGVPPRGRPWGLPLAADRPSRRRHFTQEWRLQLLLLFKLLLLLLLPIRVKRTVRKAYRA